MKLFSPDTVRLELRWKDLQHLVALLLGFVNIRSSVCLWVEGVCSVSLRAPVPSESAFYAAKEVPVSSTSILTSAVWEFILFPHAKAILLRPPYWI